ncbi:hypothetical protein GCM10010195_24220 [Kitasatospora griseola]|nr:hypothetical protein GCM10010195_24220 [Kitasatospora griseola]
MADRAGGRGGLAGADEFVRAAVPDGRVTVFRDPGRHGFPDAGSGAQVPFRAWRIRVNGRAVRRWGIDFPMTVAITKVWGL